MTAQAPRLIVLAACTVILTGLAVFLTINYGPVPRWSELSGTQTQNWISGPFVRLAYLMISLLVISTIVMIWAVVLHRRSKRPFGKLWIAGVVTFLFVQMLNLMLSGADYDLAMNAGALDPEAALQNTRDWVFFNNIRSALFLLNVIILLGFFMLPKMTNIDSI